MQPQTNRVERRKSRTPSGFARLEIIGLVLGIGFLIAFVVGTWMSTPSTRTGVTSAPLNNTSEPVDKRPSE